jgi:ATP-binding cassette subfamily B protein
VVAACIWWLGPLLFVMWVLVEIGLRSLAILLAVTMSAGSISLDDITLTWTLAGLPDVDRLERDLTPVSASATATALSADFPAPVPEPIALTAAVRFEDVRFRYPSGTSGVLANLDLELAADTSTALVGVNGAGKSTPVSLLTGLREPDSGRISVDGTDIRPIRGGTLAADDRPDAAEPGSLSATVRRAKQIAVLDGGAITERGTHDELVALGGTYGQMYELQAERFAS